MAESDPEDRLATLDDPGGSDQPAEAQQRPTVLVVDDEEAMRDSCEQVLERKGYRVVCVPDGASALDVITAQAPSVVLVDLKMPGMSGEEFLRRARQIDPELVAIAITGYPTLSSAVDVMKAGAYDFLPKPFKAEELRIIIDRAVQKRRLARAVAKGEREKARMHDNFAAVISHQLRSPAGAVKQCLDVALANYRGQMPEGCRELIDRAARRAGLLIDLMEDWLTLAKVESRGIDAESEPVDLREVVRRAVRAARSSPHRNEVALEVELPEEPLRIIGDADALRELLFNLIDNALRYTPDGGAATVRAAPEGRGAVVEVCDTGPGIPRNELPLVFEPFYRGTGTRESHGTGLGLAIAEQIAQAHGGRIAVESEPGEGATFTVHLPPGEES